MDFQLSLQCPSVPWFTPLRSDSPLVFIMALQKRSFSCTINLSKAAKIGDNTEHTYLPTYLTFADPRKI